MSELFTKTPPTEPGWYWLRDGTGEPWIARLFSERKSGWYIAEHSYGDDFPVELMPETFMYGPRIPSPEDLATFTPSIDVDITSIRSTTMWIDQREYEAEMKRLIQPEATDKNGLINE